jgi:hypothetical protein
MMALLALLDAATPCNQPVYMALKLFETMSDYVGRASRRCLQAAKLGKGEMMQRKT